MKIEVLDRGGTDVKCNSPMTLTSQAMLFMLMVISLGYTHKNLTTCSNSANKPSTSCVRTACYKLSTSLEQAVNNL